MVMAKERLVEQYGEIRYTIGTGCSGGSLTQQQVANAYPGIYQGILPAVQLPRRVVDRPAARRLPPGPPLRREPEQVGRRASSGTRRRSPRSRATPTTSTRSSSTPSTGRRSACPTTAARASRPSRHYNAETNPGGVRCTLADYMINVFGPAARALWTPPEQAVGHGFAGLPLDNVGVQYGLEALEEGPDHAGAVRRPERRRSAAPTSTSTRTPERIAGRPARARATPTAAARSTAPTTSTRSRSSTCAGPTRARSTTPTARGRSARGSSASTGTSRNHVIWFGPRAADRRPELRDRGPARDGPLAGGRRGGPRASGSLAREDRPPTGPSDIQDRCSQVAGRRAGRRARASARSASSSRSRRATARRAPSPARASRPTPTSAR